MALERHRRPGAQGRRLSRQDGATPATGWTPSERQLERLAVRASIRRRQASISTAATVLVLGAVLTAVVLSPGWARVQETFFSWEDAKASFPAVIEAFWVNIKLFVLGEPLILLLALSVAALRTTTHPALFPLRALAVGYVDLFRGLPSLLVIYVICLGVPALRLSGVTTSLFWLGLVSLVLLYASYVSEVIRAGIESVHPAQWNGAAALGLTHLQTLRFVVVPQALRRIGPPLLNDFVSLQKDTALLASVGVFDALFAATDYASFNFNYTSLFVAAAIFVTLTIPMARFTDWVGRRVAERERAGKL